MNKEPAVNELIPTRESLIDRLRNWQDQPSWQDFFDTYWKLIYGVARKSGLSDVEAQEVVQETLIGVAKHIPTFKYDPTIGSFKTWLLNMTRWRIVAQFRKRGPTKEFRRGTKTGSGTDEINRIPDSKVSVLDAAWKSSGRRACWKLPLPGSAGILIRRGFRSSISTSTNPGLQRRWRTGSAFRSIKYILSNIG